MIDWETVGVLVGVLVVFAFAFVIGLFLWKKERRSKYDERQIAAQGVAYKAAFFTLLVYMIFYAVLSMFIELDRDKNFTGICVGIELSALVFTLICIVKDAYFRGTDNPVLLSVVFLIAGALDIFIGARGALRGDEEWGLLLAGALFLAVAVAGLVKRGVDRRHADEES